MMLNKMAWKMVGKEHRDRLFRTVQYQVENLKDEVVIRDEDINHFMAHMNQQLKKMAANMSAKLNTGQD